MKKSFSRLHTIRRRTGALLSNRRIRNHMKKTLYLIICSLIWSATTLAQERTVENRPYTDLRQFHFGVLVGTHLQDLELTNIGPQIITQDDGTTVEKVISADQDRWDPGFTVGVLGELRLNTYFQLRIAPALYFGTRHLTFRNLTDHDTEGRPTTEHQDMKTAYVTTGLELIAAGPRFNNHRPYVVAGVSPMLNLSGKDSDYIKLKRFDTYASIGMGFDFYLPFFKLRPELKFMFNLSDCLDHDHGKHIRDKNMLQYTNSVSEARSKIIALTFYFE